MLIKWTEENSMQIMEEKTKALKFIMLRCIYIGNVNQNIKLVITSTIVKR
jgi:hypothetical protein